MPHIPSSDAKVFKIPGTTGTTFTVLAAPSRGSHENAVWRVTLDPGTPAKVHQLTREEILIATAGSATASLNGSEISFNAGDALVVPPSPTSASLIRTRRPLRRSPYCRWEHGQ